MPSKQAPPQRTPQERKSQPLNTNRLALIIGAVALIAIALFVFTSNIFTPPNPNNIIPYPTITPGQGRIAFVRDATQSGGLRSLYVVNSDGNNQQQVTNSVDVEGLIAWSPTANSIVMQASVDKVSTIVRVDIGSDNKLATSAQLTADLKADSAAPAWSPDGTMIAFMSKANSSAFQLYVMNADGSNKRRLSNTNDLAGFPAWSPDGKKLIYIGGDPAAGANRDLFEIPLDGQSPTRLTDLKAALNNPTYSPDGKLIAFVQATASGGEGLILMNSDGTNIRTLDEARRISTIEFSPSGTTILYDAVTDEGANLVLYELDTERAQASTSTGDNYSPTWSPDGTMIAWASTPGNQPHKIMAAANNDAKPQGISSGEGEDSYPDWQLAK